MKIIDLIIVSFFLGLFFFLGYLWLFPAGVIAAPNVNFTDLNGKQFSLKELKGQPVVINFWATTCPGCVKEIPALIRLDHDYANQGLKIIGIAMDYDPESQVREMVAQKRISYHIVLDNDGRLAQAFNNVSLTPTTFFVNKNGTIIMQKLGEMSHSELDAIIKKLFL